MSILSLLTFQITKPSVFGIYYPFITRDFRKSLKKIGKTCGFSQQGSPIPGTILFAEGVPNIVRLFLLKYEKASILQHSVDVREQITFFGKPSPHITL